MGPTTATRLGLAGLLAAAATDAGNRASSASSSDSTHRYRCPAIWALNRGGHDPQKVYAAYAAAVEHKGQPTVILAKTIKGYGMGASGEAQNITHQAKTMSDEALLEFRDRFGLPLDDEHARAAALHRPPKDSPEMRYLHERRAALGGSLPARDPADDPLPIPDLEVFKSQLDGTGDREISTTMAFVRVLAALLRD